MSGRIKGIILNIMLPGSGHMAQGKWGWGIFYLLIALAVAIPTLGIGYLVVGVIAAFHAGVFGDASKELSKADIEKIAVASAVAQKKMAEVTPEAPKQE
jgi:hypothetical protein